MSLADKVLSISLEEVDGDGNNVEVDLVIRVVFEGTDTYKVFLDIYMKTYEIHLLHNYNSVDYDTIDYDSETLSIGPVTLPLPTSPLSWTQSGTLSNRSILENYIKGALLKDEVTDVIGMDRANHLKDLMVDKLRLALYP
jgi:hypothetical protein